MQNLIKFIVIAVFFFIAGIFISAYASYSAKENEVKAGEKKREALYSNILDGANTGPTELTVNYNSPIAAGSPLIFGGSHNPLVEHQDAWNQIQDIGITSIRKDLFTEKAIPNTTIEDYKNNKNGVADVKNWNQTELNAIKDIFINAHKRNMKTIGILAYTPGWLTYTNTGNGVPKDWEVFADIAKKSYEIHRDNLDYLEIWNEPTFDYFFNLTGSNMSREEAYKMMFKSAVKAIREVDREKNDGKRIKIGGPVAHRPFDTSLLEAILKDPDLAKELDFISYHNYDAEHLKEPSDIHFRALLEQYHLEKLPIFITEWNHMPNDSKPDPLNTGIDAILYTGNKFIGFLKMGLTGANYHVLEPLNKKRQNGGVGYYGFYEWQDDKAILVPQARTWRLFSNKMGLGKGGSQVYGTTVETDDMNSVAFKNSDGQYGVTVVNSSPTSQMIELNLGNTGIGNYAQLQIFDASENNEAMDPVYAGLMKAQEDGKFTFRYPIPAKTIIGITLKEEKEWFDNLPLPIEKLFK
ncbi:hypothetical protein BH09PAT2_BH09PAT2_01490 [soil metagenome]